MRAVCWLPGGWVQRLGSAVALHATARWWQPVALDIAGD